MGKQEKTCHDSGKVSMGEGKEISKVDAGVVGGEHAIVRDEDKAVDKTRHKRGCA